MGTLLWTRNSSTSFLTIPLTRGCVETWIIAHLLARTSCPIWVHLFPLSLPLLRELGLARCKVGKGWETVHPKVYSFGPKMLKPFEGTQSTAHLTSHSKRSYSHMVFPVVTYGCETWTMKKAEHQRIDAFKLWCWKRLLRVPWTERRPNQSILKEIKPECYWKDYCWSSNTLAAWCKEPAYGKDTDAGKDWGQEEKRTAEDEMAR